MGKRERKTGLIALYSFGREGGLANLANNDGFVFFIKKISGHRGKGNVGCLQLVNHISP